MSLICAHAAGADLGPENSLQAAQASLESLEAQDLIEIDIQETSDGHPVLIHGDIIDGIRFAIGQSSTVRDTTLHDLRLHHPGLATLEEMIKLISGRCGLVLDVKDPKINVGKLREVVGNRYSTEVYLTAANHSILKAGQEEVPNWKRVAQCRTATKGQINRAIEECSPAVIDVWPPFLSREKVRYIKSIGLDFVPGGMPEPFSRFGDNPNKVRNYVRWGAQYIVTSNPAITRQIIYGH